MKSAIAHTLTHAVAVIVSAFSVAASRIENALYQKALSLKDSAYDHGVAAEQAIVNQAKADLDAARRYLEATTARAQATLKALPTKLESLRQKVYE